MIAQKSILQHPFLSILPWIVWIGIAGSIGLLIATQPVGVVVIVGVMVAFGILATITPFAALAILLILAPMRTLIATEAQFQLPLDIGQILFMVFLASYAISRIMKAERLFRFPFVPLVVSLSVFLLILGLNAFVAYSLTAWLNETLKWVQILILIVIVFTLVRSREWEWLVFAVVLAGVANALVGIYEFLGGSGALHLVINGRFFRAFGTFGQPNPFGGFMGLLTPIALMAALGYILRTIQIYRASKHIELAELAKAFFYGLSTLIMLIGILMSWSRGAWLGLGGAIAVIALALPRQTFRGIALFASGGLLVGLLAVAGLLPASIIERLSTSTQEFFAFEDVRGVDITPENFAVAERLAHWQVALNAATSSPWLGVGFGNYEVVYPQFRLINWSEPLGHAHNYFLNILAELGIVGLLGYGKVWLVIIWMTWRTKRHPDVLARFVAIGLLGTWVYLNIHSIFDNLYVNNLFLHLGLMLGILVVLYQQTQKSIRL